MKNKAIAFLLLNSLFFCGCANATQSSTTGAIVTAKVIDKTAPAITTTDKTVEEGETVKLTDCYSVKDAVTKEPKTSVACNDENVAINDNVASFKNSGEFTFTVEAVDDAGNKSKGGFKVTVNKKPEPTPTPTPEATATPEAKSQSSDSNGTQKQQSSQQSQSITQEQTQPETSNTQQEQTTTSSQPVTKYFMFSDGYTMTTALPACKAEWGNYGNGTKKCDPIVGDDGVYKGYVFTYTPN